MPFKYVIIPSPTTLIDPKTGKPVTLTEIDPKTGKPRQAPPVTLREVVKKLLYNAIWARSYDFIKSARAIDEAFASEDLVIPLAEEDWKRLKTVIENPGESTAAGNGYGFHAAVLPQLLTHYGAIMGATDERPAQVLPTLSAPKVDCAVAG